MIDQSPHPLQCFRREPSEHAQRTITESILQHPRSFRRSVSPVHAVTRLRLQLQQSGRLRHRLRTAAAGRRIRFERSAPQRGVHELVVNFERRTGPVDTRGAARIRNVLDGQVGAGGQVALWGITFDVRPVGWNLLFGFCWRNRSYRGWSTAASLSISAIASTVWALPRGRFRQSVRHCERCRPSSLAGVNTKLLLV